MYTTFDISPSGNLIIALTDAGKQWLAENEADYENDEELFIALNEDQLCNGFHLVNPDDIKALTSSLLISDEFIDEETTSEQHQHITVWYYDYYAVYSYVQDLKEQGYVVWNRA